MQPWFPVSTNLYTVTLQFHFILLDRRSSKVPAWQRLCVQSTAGSMKTRCGGEGWTRGTWEPWLWEQLEPYSHTRVQSLPREQSSAFNISVVRGINNLCKHSVYHVCSHRFFFIYTEHWYRKEALLPQTPDLKHRALIDFFMWFGSAHDPVDKAMPPEISISYEP